MARVTEAEVRMVIETAIADLSAFILAASLVIDRYSTKCTDATADELKELERWLSAHLVAVADRAGDVKEETVGPVSVSYGSSMVSGQGLLSTKYGNQVALLDPCGMLVNSGKRAASVQAVVSDLSTYP